MTGSITSPVAGRDAFVRLDVGGGAFVEYRLRTWHVESRAASIEVSSFDSPYANYLPGRHTITLAGELSHTEYLPGRDAKDDAERLAQAIWDGDTDAALLAADEVQLRYSRGPRYVPRDRLLNVLRRLVKQLESAREFGCDGLGDDQDLTLLPRVLVNMGDLREAEAILDLEERA